MAGLNKDMKHTCHAYHFFVDSKVDATSAGWACRRVCGRVVTIGNTMKLIETPQILGFEGWQYILLTDQQVLVHIPW